MQNKLSLLLIISLSLFLSGCAENGIKMSVQDKKIVKNIHIHEHFTCPNFPDLVNLHYVAGGLLVAAIDGIANDVQAKPIRDLVIKNQLSIAEIVKKQIINQIQIKNKFNLTDAENADAILVINIISYGLNTKTAFEDFYKPTLDVEATLVSKDNKKVIWQNEQMITAEDNTMTAYKLNAIKNNPNHLINE